MRVGHVVPSLEQRHGGPSVSVRALANASARLGTGVELLSTACRGADAPVAAPGEAPIRVFPRLTPRSLCRSPELDRCLQSAPFDVIHHHSLWLLTLRYAWHAAKSRRVPLVISPRGMMSPWAWRHHRLRKALAGHLLHPGALQGAAGWHATSPEEADDIRRLGFRQPVCVAPNGVTVPEPDALAAAAARWRELCPQAAGRRIALFYSRFHRKKRVRELLDLWPRVARDDWFLLLAGVPEEYEVAEIRTWIDRAGAGERMAVFDGRAEPPPYAVASLFLLPSHSENFGLVVAEALAAGVPALVTDTTPWSGLSARDAGWCVPWDRFCATAGAALATEPARLADMGRRGRAWVARDYSWDRAARLLDAFHRDLTHAGT
ncbi:MAG TPA: glycosyltransferase [Lacunisphaera sp.]|nr:glycosyltransferase [Lacunisphaera sp.]